MSSSEPLVDVGMPAYCRPDLIAESIESVLAQTHANWQLVVSENGTGGGEVEEAVRSFTDDPRISYVATGRNLGPAANWTRLIQTGNAQYLTLIQDDDVWDPHFLAARVNFLEQHPSCGFVFSGERMMDARGREIAVERTRALPRSDISEVLDEGVYQPEEFFFAMYRHRLGGIHTPSLSSGGVMSRRSALEFVGPYFDDSVPFLFWDIELYTRLALSFPTGFLPRRDVAQRIGISPQAQHVGITSESTLSGERWIAYHSYYEDWIRRELPDLKLPRQFNKLRADAYIMAALDAVEQGHERTCASHLRSAARVYPPALLNPRMLAGAVGLLLGNRGMRVLARARGAARRRNEVLVYERADTEGV